MIICFFFTSLIALGQSNVTVLNGYKSIYLMPLTYKDGSSDKFGLRSFVKDKLVSKGFKITEADADLKGSEGCFIVACVINHTNNFYQHYPDRIELKFINCTKEQIFTLEGASNTSMVDYTPEKGLAQATERAFDKINNYYYSFDLYNSVPKQFERNLPSLEMTGLTEDSIKSYLESNKLEPIEGIYKSYQSDVMPYYKLGIVKVGNIYKAVIIETELTYWKKGELKATFEQSSMKGLYSTKWYMGNKTPYETFASIDNEVLLTLELKDMKTGEKKQDKFIKMFPTSTESSVSKKDNTKAYGSGFFITSSGIIATNAHVIKDASKFEIIVSNEIGTFTYKAKVLLTDSKNDVALLQIDDEKFRGLTAMPYGISERGEVGEKVFTIGYPLNDVMGTNYKLTDGIISAKSGIEDDIRYYQISVPLQPGNSGGPLFNRNGNVIGITSSKLNSKAVGTEVQNVNYAIKASYLLNLYHMLPNPVKLESTSLVANKRLQDQVKVLKNYVCLIKVY